MQGKFKMTLSNGFSFNINELVYGDSMDSESAYSFKIDIASTPTAQSLFHKLEEYLTEQNLKNVTVVDAANETTKLYFSFTGLVRHELVINDYGSMIQFILK